jgi:hypothetical protein
MATIGRNAGKYEKKVSVLPKNLDEKVARPHLDKLGVRPTRSIVEHGHCRPPVSGLQFKKERAGFLNVLLGTTLGGRL